MTGTVLHLQINVSNPKESLPFYKELFSYFKYKVIDESSEHMGVSNGNTDFWFIKTEPEHKKAGFHRKRTGLNHVALRARSKVDLDMFVKDFLRRRKIKTLYDTPRYFPEYGDGYYAVFFEDPDRIKWEVVFKP